MKFTIERDALIAALAFVTGAVERRTTIPILSTVRIETRSDGVHFAATDLDMRAESHAVCDVMEKGAVATAAHALEAFAKKLPRGAEVSFSLERETRNDSAQALVVKAGRARLNAPVLAVEDFPAMADMGAACTFPLPAWQLRRLIEKTRLAISTEETRYYLCGLLLHFASDAAGEDVLRAVATDGHVLALADVNRPANVEGSPVSAIVPRAAINEARKMIADLDDSAQVEVAVSESMFRLRAGPAELTAKLIDGSFPDYLRVIPKANPIKVACDRFALGAAIERVMVVASDRSHALTLRAHGEALKVSTRSVELGADASDEIDAESPETAIECGFNGRLLAQALGQGSTQEAVLEFGADAGAPVIVRDKQDARALYVVMPLRTSS